MESGSTRAKEDLLNDGQIVRFIPHGPRLNAVNGIAVLERCGSTADKWHFAYDFAFKARGTSSSP